MVVGTSWHAIRHRESARRREQPWHRDRRERAAGWLHASQPQFGERHQRDHVRETQFRFHPRHRTRRESRPLSLRPRSQPIGSDKVGSRTDRLCQSQPRQAQHRVGRHGNARPHRRRALQDDDRRRHGAHTLPRRGLGAHRPARRTGSGHDRQYGCLPRTHPRWEAACTGGDDSDAPGDVAGCANCRRVCAWV